MIEHTFCHIPRVSVRAENKLWSSGIHSWSDALKHTELPIAKAQRDAVPRYLEESNRQLDRRNPNYFADLLPSQLHWRLFPEFRAKTAYLDIETTGLSGSYHKITTIALYDGTDIKHYVQGQNLDEFEHDVRDYTVLVTYNGKCFDLPFLHQSLGVDFPQVHIDLRYLLNRLGYKGGLKGCEKQMGLDRHELDGVDGYTAVLLWQEYTRTRNPRALDTLLAYNIQDVLNLEILIVKAHNLLVKQTPFEFTAILPLPVLPENPFQADTPLLQRMLGAYQRTYTF
jgi:uncharacterized protein YprB with RNaseH-like and TPR domain